MIRLAKETELLEIISITKACTAHMIDQGIYQWNDDYPSKKAFIKDINRKEIMNYYNKYYTSDNLLISFSGKYYSTYIEEVNAGMDGHV